MIKCSLALVFVLSFANLASAQSTGFVSCNPAINGTLACPCGNAPSGLGRGCNNSAATGGAALNATGLPSLSADTVLFTAWFIGTSGPACSAPTGNVLSVLYESTGVNVNGSIWGDGVMCCSGTYFLLSVQVASSGTMVYPTAASPTVSATAISAGDVGLLPGAARCYFVAYRDSCPSFCPSSPRQLTNSYQITWLP